MRRFQGLLVFILGVFAVTPQAVLGTVVQVEFSGTVDTVKAGTVISDSVFPGDEFNGTYRYDTNGTDVQSAPDYGVYRFPQYSVNVNVGSLTFSTIDTVVVAFNGSWSSDVYKVGSWTHFEEYGVDWSSMGFFLTDESRTALQGEALPDPPPSLQVFDVRVFQLAAGRIPWIRGTVTSLSPVPEPSTALLLAAGLLALYIRERRSAQPGGRVTA